MKVVGVIPARYHSTRFPGKVLAPIDGIPMVARVFYQAKKCEHLDSVVVATDSHRVFEKLQPLHIPLVMTASAHVSGTERVAEVAANGDGGIYVNIQGDEPFIEPEVIDLAVEPFLEGDMVKMGTVASNVLTDDEWTNADVVKVRVDEEGLAKDFFRLPSSSQRDENCYKHIGLYVYERGFLLDFARMGQTRREKERDLEQMRALDHGFGIRVVLTDYDGVGINTPEDLNRILEMSGVG